MVVCVLGVGGGGVGEGRGGGGKGGYVQICPSITAHICFYLITKSKRLACWVKFSADDILRYVSYFSQKKGFHVSCNLSILLNPVFLGK